MPHIEILYGQLQACAANSVSVQSAVFGFTAIVQHVRDNVSKDPVVGTGDKRKNNSDKLAEAKDMTSFCFNARKDSSSVFTCK